MSRFIFSSVAFSVAILCFTPSPGQSQSQGQSQSSADGKSIFRFDTYGDEQLWTDVLQLQNVIKNVSPRTALSVGLKVDSDALPEAVINAIKAGQVNLDDPAVTVPLLKLNSVVGGIGKVAAPKYTPSAICITRAPCPSSIHNALPPRSRTAP